MMQQKAFRVIGRWISGPMLADTIEKLLKIKWWDWADDKIKQSFALWPKPEEFIRYYGE